MFPGYNYKVFQLKKEKKQNNNNKCITLSTVIDFLPDGLLEGAQDSKHLVELTHLFKSFKFSTLLFITICIEKDVLSHY